ncbi:selenide, water dikinase SelD [Marinobacter panjinensis]|uniref:Selenide, water dikinase SelD n=1 Tax=Marinobacter panjinensis TaxID=2576384 RepID=A0A4U6R0R4_9GAMM|nr:selenide, water dikinase SelD [Marinobacter panjinensis]MCR8915993.1 selenide, water dikinase SelD [Marinobacter panjinensis]TKV67040.1 selenide, water dikinase SelD [Marinobacter panjinensis]
MQQSEQPVLRDIVLVGGGHSHVGVLKRFAMNPVPGVRLTLICRDTHTPYSGMLPGYVAGHYTYDDVHIDLSKLAEFAGARFYRDEAIGIDRNSKRVNCRSRPDVPYDILSVNIGSSPRVGEVDGAREHAVPVKPINGFNNRWLSLLSRLENHEGPMSVAVVGAGAGGVELTLAMQFRLRNELEKRGHDPDQLHFHLFDAESQILPTHNDKVRAVFADKLASRGVKVHLGAAVSKVEAGHLTTESSESHAVDEVLWVTRAGGPQWLEDTGLALDDGGFIRVRDTLQTETDDDIFAVGDIANVVNHPREKAGVFAVRQGRPLADNLKRYALGKAVKPFSPQKKWLALISTGDKFAVASRGDMSFAGKWVWRWKNQIDKRFMAKFNDLPAMKENSALPDTGAAQNAEEASQAISAVAMRCGGCGAKVGSTVLSRALGELRPIERDDILIGLHAPDDAAVLTVPPGKAVVHTVDFFRAFIDDPYLFGKVAANHALGDVFAMGAEAQSATAVATVPYGIESKVEDVVYQMMSGAVEVLNEAGCALVGGHTGEGRELALGFAVNGLIDPDEVMSKGGLRAGDVLILTKPIGTGTLFAAHAKLEAKGRWIDVALASMVQSNKEAAQCLRRYGSKACTDVTGFGLLGHLVEMTRPSGVDAELDLGAIPILPGAEETAAAGILSSLQPANIRLRRGIRDQEKWVKHPRYPLIFDPQTAGGLLASVPADQAEACVSELKALGYPHTAVIGRVLPQDETGPIEPITLRE